MKYRTIVADPPWQFGSAVTKADARKHYNTMSTDAIAALPVSAMAEDSAHLWLWGLNGMLREAHEVAIAWGFRPITIVTWCKPGPGVGHYLRNNTEHCVFATRGKPMVPEIKPTSTWFVWSRGAHSAKPEAFFDVVQTVSPYPYVELFARSSRLGWDSWGNQSLGSAEMAA